MEVWCADKARMCLAEASGAVRIQSLGRVSVPASHVGRAWRARGAEWSARVRPRRQYFKWAVKYMLVGYTCQSSKEREGKELLYKKGGSVSFVSVW